MRMDLALLQFPSGVTDPPIKGGGCPEQTAGPGRPGSAETVGDFPVRVH
jgi:hypothetical protein